MPATISLRSTTSDDSCAIQKNSDGSVTVSQPRSLVGAGPLTKEFVNVDGARVTLSPAVAAGIVSVLQTS